MRRLVPIFIISLAVPIVAGRALADAAAPIALEGDEPAPSGGPGDPGDPGGPGDPPDPEPPSEPPPDQPAPPPEPSKPAEPEKDAGKPDAGPKPEFPPCIEVHAHAVHNSTGFDHVVSIANGCERDADCEVTTDVSPELIAVSVPASETRELVTFRGSPTHEFNARVKCELQQQ